MLRLPPTKIELGASDLVWHSNRFEKRRVEKSKAHSQHQHTERLSRLPYPLRRFKAGTDDSVISYDAVPQDSEEFWTAIIANASGPLKRPATNLRSRQSSTSNNYQSSETTLQGPAVGNARRVVMAEDKQTKAFFASRGRPQLSARNEHWSMDSNPSSEDEYHSSDLEHLKSLSIDGPNISLTHRLEKSHERPLASGIREFKAGATDEQIDLDGSSDSVKDVLVRLRSRAISPSKDPPSPDLPPFKSSFSLASRNVVGDHPARLSSPASGSTSPMRARNITPSSFLHLVERRSRLLAIDEPFPGSQRRGSTPPPLPPPPQHTPHRRIRIYDDSLPASSQPQTPVGLPRHGVPLMQMAGAYTAPAAPASTRRTVTPDSFLESPTRIGVTFTRDRSARMTRVPRNSDQENDGVEIEMRRTRLRQSEGRGNTRNDALDLESTPPREERRNLG